MAVFRFRVEGQPPSWNVSFRISRNSRTKGLFLRKTEIAEQYQSRLVAPAARRVAPKGWKPQGWVRVRYWFHFKRRMDADNALKMLNDGIASGLGFDDKWILPCVESVAFNVPQPYVEIEVSDVA